MNRKANLKGYFTLFNRAGGKLIATFGQARLIQRVGRQYELQGGSREDRLSAHEWVSLFMHDAVVTDGTRPGGRLQLSVRPKTEFRDPKEIRSPKPECTASRGC